MKSRIIGFIFIIGVMSMNTHTIKADENYITRINAVTMLIDAVIRTSGSQYVSWDDCYVEDGKGGYNLDMGDRTEYALIYALYPHLASVPFNDIAGLTKHQKIALSLAYNSQIITGFSDKTFRPNDYLTYMQAIKIIVWACSFGYEYKDYDQPLDFYQIAVNNNISDSAPISGLLHKEHELTDFVLNDDYCPMLDTLPSNFTRVFMAFRIPQSYTECAEIFASNNSYNPYMQYPLISDELVNEFNLQRDEFILTGRNLNHNPYISYLEYKITEVPTMDYGQIKCFEIVFSSMGGRDVNTNPVRYINIELVDGKYEICGVV